MFDLVSYQLDTGERSHFRVNLRRDFSVAVRREIWE